MTTASRSRPASGLGARAARLRSPPGRRRDRGPVADDDVVLPGSRADAADARTTVDAAEITAAIDGSRPRGRREPLLAAAQPRRRAHVAARGRASIRGRVVLPPSRPPVATTPLRATSKPSSRPASPARCTRPSITAQPARARGPRVSPTRPPLHNFFDLDRAARRPRRDARASSASPPTTLVMLQPARAIERKNVPGGVRYVAAPAAPRCPTGRVRSGCPGPAEDGYEPNARPHHRTRHRAGHGRTAPRPSPTRTRRATLVVFPSTWEGFGNPIIESIGARRALRGVPVSRCSARSSRPACATFSTEQPDVLVRFLARTGRRRETYFDVNLRRARLSFSLADLPTAIEQAFSTHGWIAW